MPKPAFRILFALYPGMTQLDFTGPYQFFSRWSAGEVIVASRDGGEVPADGLVFAHTTRLSDVSGCELICVPGGINALDAALDDAFIAELRRLATGARYVTSVCTGSLILGAAGLLQGRRAACHWAWRDFLPVFGAIADPGRVVRDGNIITGGGVTAGIDFALAVLAEIGGADIAQGLQLGLEYAPAPPFNAGRPEDAPHDIVASYCKRLAPVIASRQDQAQEAALRLAVERFCSLALR